MINGRIRSELVLHHPPQENLNPGREELLQQFLDQMFSVMKEIHRDTPHELLLSPPQARLVFTIAKHQTEGISVKDLANLVKYTPGAITQFVDILIAKDLVRREEDSNDRRIVRLKLTPSARSQMNKFRKALLSSTAVKFSVLSDEELRQLQALLAKVSSPSFVHDKKD
jgi:DNA-binding MarR family transcriptional regulator